MYAAAAKKAGQKRRADNPPAAAPARDDTIVPFWTDRTATLSHGLPPCALIDGHLLEGEAVPADIRRFFGPRRIGPRRNAVQPEDRESSVWFTTIVTQLPPPVEAEPLFDGDMSAAIADNLKVTPQVKRVAKNDRMTGQTPTGPSADRAHKAKAHEHPVRTRRLRVYPTPEHHVVLQAWFDAQRWTYNACVTANKSRTKGVWLDVEDLRNRFVYADGIAEQVRQGQLTEGFALDVLTLGNSTRDRAVDDFVKAREHERKKWEVNPKHRYEFKYRSRRDEQSMLFEHRDWIMPASNRQCPRPSVAAKVRTAAAEDAAGPSVPATSKRQQRRQQKQIEVTARCTATRAKGRARVEAAIKASGLQSYLRREDVLKMAPPCPKGKDPVAWQQRWEAQVPQEMPMVYTLTYTRRGRYYLQYREYVPVKEPLPATAAPKHSVASIDPGSRTPFTVYDADGRVVEIAPGDGYRIYKALLRADDIKSRLDKVATQGKPRSEFPAGEQGTTEWRLHNKRARNQSKCHRRALRRDFLAMLERVRDRVRDMHTKTASWLVQTYRTILIPTFESSQMVARWSRKLNNKTARTMLGWAHYGFRQTLKQRAELQAGCTVIEVDEPYTSQTCGRCGSLYKTGDKIYRCRNTACGYVADRDFNGARCILLRYLTRVVCA